MKKPETETLGYVPSTWETKALLYDILSDAETLAEQTEAAISKLRDNIFDPSGEEFLSEKDSSDYIISAEKLLYKLCKSLSLITTSASFDYTKYQRSCAEKRAGAEGLITVMQFENLVIIKAPYLQKLRQINCESDVAFNPLAGEIYSLRKELFACSQADMYILSVYGLDTPESFIVDADNINVKALGDPLTQVLEIDDNGQDVSLHIYALKTDDLEGSSYVVLMPNQDEKLNPNQLKNLILAKQNTYAK